MAETSVPSSVWETNPVYELGNRTQGNFVGVFEAPAAPGFECIGLEWRWPTRSNAAHFYTELDESTEELVGTAEREIVLSATPYLGDIAYLQGHVGTDTIMDALGYQIAEAPTVNDGVQVTQVVFTFGNIDRNNRIIKTLSSNSDTEALVSYPNGKYSPLELAQALVDGAQPIAEDILYKLHERTALHEYAAVFLKGSVLEGLIRADLSRLVDIVEQGFNNDENIYNAAMSALREFTQSYDGLSTSLAKLMISGVGSAEAFIRIKLMEFARQDLESRYHNGLGQIFNPNKIDEITADLITRYQYARAFAA